MLSKKRLGWSSHFENQNFVQENSERFDFVRILEEQKGSYFVSDGKVTKRVFLSGKLHHLAQSGLELPSVGDWVAISSSEDDTGGLIHHVLDRKTKVSRKTVGKRYREQVIGSNIDYLWIVTSCNEDFNLRRMERYLLLAWESGATPMLILNKTDLAENPDYYKEQLETIAFGIPIYCVSAKNSEGIEQIESTFEEGKTIALIGSSGVGKSSIVNALFHEAMQEVRGIREDDAKGKHTTTARHLFQHPSGVLVMDTPGMRELQLWCSDTSASQTFSDIEELAEECNFRDCSHINEPGCAILEAILSGHLEKKRLRNYMKLQNEIRYLERKQAEQTKKQQKFYKKFSKKERMKNLEHEMKNTPKRRVLSVEEFRGDEG